MSGENRYMNGYMRNNVDLKQNNIREIIRLLKLYPDITKNDIAEKMSMTVASAHNFISELLEKGICISTGTVFASSGRRKSVQYRLNKDYGYIIGITLSRVSIHFTAHNLVNSLLAEKTHTCDIHDMDSTTEKLLSGVSEFMSEKKLRNKNCLCMGITIPGRTDKGRRIALLPDC